MDREAWRERLLRAADARTRATAVRVRRELARFAAEAADAGQFTDAVEHRQRLEAILTAEASATALRFGAFGQRMLREAREFDIALAFRIQVAEWVRRIAPERARRIADRSQQAVTDTLAQAALEGVGEAETARRLRAEVGGTLARSRARTIARTEVGAAQNVALILIADDAGLRVRRQWLANEDSRTRPTHAAADGQIIEPGERFRVGSAHLAHPSDPNGPAREVINCRCTVLLLPD